MKTPPCKNCERRTVRPNCHGTCQDYKDFVQERNQYREERQKETLVAAYIKASQKRNKRR